MALSNSYNYVKTRDQVITRALRIVGAIGQGETPDTTAVTEAAEVLNDLVKEWETDGMQLWCVRQYLLQPVASGPAYTFGIGGDVDQPAPMKLLQAWSRNTDSSRDTPILIITRQEYNMLGNKTQEGSPSQIWYDPPGSIAVTEAVGTGTLYVVPSTEYVAHNVIYVTGVRPIMDFDAADDVIDFPQYWNNAVTWGLADQLSFEYGVGLSERSMIAKKAEFHKEKALSYGTEEGHLLIQPAPHWQPESW